uniref:RasGEF domain-containing protein n=1 Tax=Wuchereria bancrofti TaxID=6293 RepID=A0A1I8EUC8_WUCBA
MLSDTSGGATRHSMSISVGDATFNRSLAANRQSQWKSQKVFIDRIYQISNNCHPGIGLDQAAAEHIQEILICLFFELLESHPQTIEDMERNMRTTLPASMFHWVMQFQNTPEALHRIPRKKLHDKRNANSKSLMSLLHMLQPKLKELLGYKLDEEVMLYLLSVIEYIAADILKWTGNYVKNIRKCDPTIGLQNLKIALSADTSLMELTEMLYNEEETSTAGILNDNVEDIVQEMSYDEASRDFNREEAQYLRDLNLIIHVFRRRFEIAFEDDTHCLDEMFGNILELHELTVKVQRMLEDAIEMSDTPCVGAGLWELAEAHEFDVYIAYMDLFKQSLTTVIEKVLNDAKYEQFFLLEDRTHSITPGGETFRLAVKYVLPSLLEIPVVHFFRYVEFTNILCHLAQPPDEIEDLKSTKSYFSGLAVKVESLCPLFLINHLKTEQSVRALPESNCSRQRRRIQEIQRSIELWEGKEIGYKCAEVIREGDLLLLRSGPPSSVDTLKKNRGITVRHTFLFDHLLVLCKTLRSSRPEKPLYKFKDKVLIRKTDIFDLKDTEEFQNAFKIVSRWITHERGDNTSWILLCRTPEEKTNWMCDLVKIQAKSSLDRMLDASLKEEEKRVPLILPTSDQYRFADQDCDENIVFEDYTSSSGIPVVKHGTVLKLVERLTYHLQLLIERFQVPTPPQLQIAEANNISNLESRELLNGPCAAAHSQDLGTQFSPTLLNRIERSYQRFRKEYQQPIQCRVLSVIRQWVNNHWYDFEHNPVLLQNLCSFLEETDSHGKVINQYKKWCKSIKKRADIIPSATHSALESEPSPVATTSYGPQKPKILWHIAEKGAIETYDLLSLHPIEIGRQITLLQFDLYKAIKPIELVGSAWTKRDKDLRSPQLLKLIDHSTMLTYWVARSIVETCSLDERVHMFSRVLEVMSVFEELNNFTGLVALYSALNSSSVYRLKACWERIDREKQVWYEKFKKLCNPHWKEMIERLKSINPPCVPFFGHYLSKIFFYEEGNSTFVQSEDLTHEQISADGNTSVVGATGRRVMVSFVKCRRIASIISDIQMYQNESYALEVEPSVRTINPLNGFDGKESLETYMWEQSLKVEPKDPDKMEFVKPSRPAYVLKSPGIKPPKSISLAPSTSGPSNHYSGHRASGRGFSALNNYSPNISHSSDMSRPNLLPNFEDRNSYLGMVEITPGQQPRYLGDAKRGTQSTVASPTEPRIPPVMPRTKHRNDKASSTPPSPRSSQNGHFTTPSPPPLYPRKLSTQEQLAPPPPLKVLTHGGPDLNGPVPPHSAPFCTTHPDSFVFPPYGGNAISRTIAPLESISPVAQTVGIIPTVPPRKKVEQLPSPLFGDAVHVVWNKEAKSAVCDADDTISLPSSSQNSSQNNVTTTPKLYPRGACPVEPPPRPPKLFYNKKSQELCGEKVVTERNNSDSPPPLPPKTYKRRQQHNRLHKQ